MDLILATDWIYNPYPEEKKKTPDENKSPDEEMSWLQIVDEEEKKQKAAEQKEEEQKPMEEEQQQKPTDEEQNSGNGDEDPTCTCKHKRTPVVVPLITHLCEHFKCTIKELHVLLQNLESRRTIIEHLRSGIRLRTNHLRPQWRNFAVNCNELSTHTAHTTFAMRGYLGITVQAYYYVKHGIKLRHPYLPCVVQFGGRSHHSFFPMECLSVMN